MAVTVAKLALATTRNRLAYLVTADGAGNVDLANATMVADGTFGGVAGPLAILIRDTVCASDTAALALFYSTSRIRIKINTPDWTNNIDVGQWKCTFLDDGAGNRAKINFAAAGADAVGIIVVISHRHSVGR